MLPAVNPTSQFYFLNKSSRNTVSEFENENLGHNNNSWLIVETMTIKYDFFWSQIAYQKLYLEK